MNRDLEIFVLTKELEKDMADLCSSLNLFNETVKKSVSSVNTASLKLEEVAKRLIAILE